MARDTAATRPITRHALREAPGAPDGRVVSRRGGRGKIIRGNARELRTQLSAASVALRLRTQGHRQEEVEGGPGKHESTDAARQVERLAGDARPSVFSVFSVAQTLSRSARHESC